MSEIKSGSPEIEILSEKTVFSNPYAIHSYYAWPSIARLKNGTLVCGCSGMRRKHVDPFGKSLLKFSRDEGESWSAPVVAIDTLLDDRDTGLAPFGESGLLVTSFNHTPERLRRYEMDAYDEAYLKFVDADERTEELQGSEFVMSFDNGFSFGPVHRIPVTSPHGPLELPDGTLLYVGTVFPGNGVPKTGSIRAYRIFPDGSYELTGTIETEDETVLYCEPHAVLLHDKRIIVQIRVQSKELFTIYQCESSDMGRSFTKPAPVLGPKDGAPPHLLELSDGCLLSVFARRHGKNGIYAMMSADGGRNYSEPVLLAALGSFWDLGYPASVELRDGSILTIYYVREEKNVPAAVKTVRWKRKTA